MIDAAFDALADEHRRLALSYLRDRGTVGLDDLAAVVAGWKRARASGAGRVTPDDRDRVRIALRHVHLPRLADAGILEYDHGSRTATLAHVPHVLDSLLERSLADDRRYGGPAGDREGTGDHRGRADDDCESTDDHAGGTRPRRTRGRRPGFRRWAAVSLRAFVDGAATDRRTHEAATDRRTHEAATDRRTRTVYAPEPDAALADHFGTRGVTVTHERLPDDGSGGFVVVTAHGEFVGSVPRRAARRLVSPSATDFDWGGGATNSEGSNTGSDTEGDVPPVRLPMNLLADTTFVSFDRRQLLAASREIEDRAFRRGRGTLRAGFETLARAADQRRVYDALAATPDLDVHVYGRPVGDSDSDVGLPDATVHADEDPEIRSFLFVVFDGGGDRQACALLAEAVADDPGSFREFWTYDPETVADLDAYLAAAY